MTKVLDSCLKKEKVFCAVGAAHLYGNSGMIQLLRKSGYKLRCVSAIYSEIAIQEKTQVLSKRGYELLLPEQGIVMRVGQPRS